MDFKDIGQAYFLGIGGIGMSALARYFNHLAIKVYGYDKTETALTKELVEEGINIHYTDFGFNISDLGFEKSNTLVVLTPAVPTNHEEWRWFREYGFNIMKRSEVLGLISDEYRSVAVAGTHGKTTTSAMIAHMLKQSHVDCAAFLGGIATNYQSNLLLPKSDNHTPKNAQCMVVEADEFDRSFLRLHPSVSVITSTDADHLDIYGEHDALLESFSDFAAQTRHTLFIKKELELYSSLKNTQATVKSYSIKSEADVYSTNIRIQGDLYYFDLFTGEHWLKDLHMGIPGLHNVENATGACAAALEAGVSDEELREALASFKGVKRRFEYIIRSANFTYIDDYAHHPEELRATISSVRNMYPGRKITAVFQPHLFTRTRDFADGFAESLSLADSVILLDIYPAREQPIPGITSAMLLSKITAAQKQVSTKKDLVATLQQAKPDVLLTLGAGDIDQLVQPIKSIFKNANRQK